MRINLNTLNKLKLIHCLVRDKINKNNVSMFKNYKKLVSKIKLNLTIKMIKIKQISNMV